MRRAVLGSAIALASCLAVPGLAQSTLGTVSGTFRSEGCAASAPAASAPAAFAPAPGALRIVLVEISSGRDVQQTLLAADGAFFLREVPFAVYRLEARAGRTALAATGLTVDDALPKTLDLECTSELPEKAVQGRKASAAETAGHAFFAAGDILSLPVVSREKASEAVLLQSADVVPDEDGRLHVRGEDAQVQYVVDGIPLSGNPTRVYSSLFSADIAKSIDVLGGGLPAQYAAGSAVVAVTTLDGMNQPFTARAGAGAGSYGMRETQLTGLGSLGGNTGLFLSASQSGTDRYLDPVSGFTPLHAGGEGRHFFGKLSMLPGQDAEVHVLGAFDQSGYQVPNSLDRSPGQDQGAALQSWLAGARLDWDPGAGTHVSATLYTRRTESRLTSGGLARIGSSADSLRAVRENERFFIGADRENGYHGGQAELTLQPAWGGGHRLRMGVSAEINPLRESLAFAVTDSSLAAAQSDSRLASYDLTHGGSPLEARSARTGWTASAYLQDAFELGKWSFLSGLRYDAFSLFETEQALSPRLAAAYAWSRDLDLRASLDFLTARAPLENILLSSEPALRPLAGDDQGTTSATVGAERTVAFDLGADWRFGRYLVFDAGGYAKYIRNFLVKAELGASGLIFPLNLKEGVVAGGVLTIRLREWNRLSGKVSLGSCASLGRKPADGGSPIAAGLLVGEEGHNYGHPFAGEDFFPTEHNQIATAVLNARYRMTQGLSATVAGRFDSGLPFDLVGPDGMALDEQESRAELRRRGYGDAVINLLSLAPEEPGSPDKSVAPHAVFDLGMEWNHPIAGSTVEVRAAVLNLLDTPYLQKFESSFGSTHFGQGRTLGLWVTVGY